jgi:cbb3-type cytochrome oxidase cytochrome c subunit
MILDTGTLIAIVIALAGSITIMCLFWKQNIEQQKEIRRLQVALRDKRNK